MIDINLHIDEKRLFKDIVREIKKIIFSIISDIQSSLEKDIKFIVKNRLTNGVPTISGQDYYELGIPDINNRMINIVNVAADSVYVKVYQDSTSLLKIDLGILQSDYKNLLDLPDAVYAYTSRKSFGVLPWLRWLLIDGGGQIISNYEYNATISPYSRTRGGIMVTGTGWSVPSTLAGTPSNNILTRALSNIDKDIEKIVMKELKRKLK